MMVWVYRNKGDGHHEQDHTGVQAATQEEEDLDESGEYVVRLALF